MFWNIAFLPLKVLLPLLSGIVVTRLLGKGGFADLALVMALLNTLGLFADFGIERTLPRFYPEIEMRYGRRGVARLLFWVSAVKGAVLLVLVVALAVAPDFWTSSLQLGSEGYWLLLLVGLLLVLGAASDISVQLLYTHFRQKVTNSLDVLAAVVRPTLAAGFVLLGWGVLGAMLALFITTVLSVGFSMWQAWRLIRAIPEEPHRKADTVKRPSNRPLRSRLFLFAGLNYLINWTVYLYDQSFVVLFLSWVLVSDVAIEQVAIIALAYRFTKEFLRALVIPLTGVQTPLFARLYAEGRIDGLKTAYASFTKLLLLALIPAGVGLILVARDLLKLLYGQIGLDKVMNPVTTPIVISCTVILAVGLFGEAAISVALNVLMVYEDYKAVLVARLMSLVSVPLLLALVPPYGAVGAAVAVSVTALLSRSVALAYGLRRLGLKFPSRFFVRVGSASAVMGFALLPFLAYFPPPAPLPNLPWPTLFMVVLGAAIFFLTFKLLGGIDREDKERFRTMRIPLIEPAMRLL